MQGTRKEILSVLFLGLNMSFLCKNTITFRELVDFIFQQP